VLDAAVIGVQIPGTEVPRAYVVTNKDITAHEIKDFVKGHVADYKQLRGGVVFIDAIVRFQQKFWKVGLLELIC
jgi:4-coumarate--CoA ligase